MKQSLTGVGTKENRSICFVPRTSGIGGMVSFQEKLAAGLQKRGFQVSYDLADQHYAAILVTGGTRNLPGLWRARRRGIPIVQRLDGMNWLHRLRRPDGMGSRPLQHFLRAEYGNFILAFIRAHLARHIVYQSQFSRQWWERVHAPAPVPCSVIYNGVDLELYSPLGPGSPPPDCFRLLLVEGSLMGGYEMGLEVAVNLAAELQRRGDLGRPLELTIAGRVPDDLKPHWEGRASLPLHWLGQVERARIPEIDRSAHLLYSADINAACPNSVIEALACGLPVVSFDTGALPELVDAASGGIVPYGGNPWRLETPDVAALADKAAAILFEPERFRRGAHRRAAAIFSLDTMVDSYLQVLLG